MYYKTNINFSYSDALLSNIIVRDKTIDSIINKIKKITFKHYTALTIRTIIDW